MNRFPALLFPLFLLSACVQLSPAGARVSLREAPASVPDCQWLGTVSVSSTDALRNTAAALEGDTAVWEHIAAGSAPFIKGNIYRCQISPAPVAVPTLPLMQPVVSSALPATAAPAEPEAARKAKLCAGKGGSWTGTQCVVVIPIE